jgi:hypothetical protein
MAELRLSCGNYVFPSQDADNGIAEPVLHPQWLITRIFEMYLQRPHFDERSFGLLSDIFDLLPEESDIPGAVSLEGLIDLLATGAVDCEMDTAFNFDTSALTWKALYYAGALTHDCHLAGTFRVASGAALSLVSRLL